MNHVIVISLSLLLYACGPGLCTDAGVCGGALLMTDSDTYAFGQNGFNASVPKTVLITNRGTSPATQMTSGSLSAPFGFYGGAYPGTGGTCGESLAAGESCTVVLVYEVPSFPAASHSAPVEVSYLNSGTAATLTLTATGSSYKGFFNRATGFDATVTSLVYTANGLMAGGYFRAFGSNPAGYLAQFDSQLKLNSSFNSAAGVNAGFGSAVSAMAHDPSSGDTYFGGYFTTYNALPNIRYIVRLNADGSQDLGFDIGSGASAGLDSVPEALAMAADGSGDLYAGGVFTTYRGTTNKNRIVRLNTDGTVDVAFDIGAGASAGFNATVRTIAPLSDGTVYVGGDFNNYNSTPNINKIIRLLSTGGIDPGFNIGSGATAGFNGDVYRLLPDGSGNLYAVGNFTSYNNTAGYNRIIRLKNDGSIDAAFNPGAGFDNFARVVAAAPDGSGDIYVSGAFTSYNGTPANGLVRLNSDGTLDTGFGIGAGFNVFPVAILPSNDGTGDILLAGNFVRYNNQVAVRVARLNGRGELLSAYSHFSGTSDGFDTGIAWLAPANDGTANVYVAGNFKYYNATSAASVARIRSDGSLDTHFATGTGVTGTMNILTLAADGSQDIYIGGNFTAFNGTSVGRIARLNSDGSLDGGFNTGSGFDNSVFAIANSSDATGDLYVGGVFQNFNGTSNIRRIARLNHDGTLDTGFNIGSGASAGFDSFVVVISQDPNGSGDVYVGGTFTSYNSITNINRIVRLNNDGSIDSSFSLGVSGTPGFNSQVSAVTPAVDGSGDIYVGGFFTSYDGTANINGIVRLNSNGTVDTGFNIGTGVTAGVGPTNPALAFAPLNDGTGAVYVGGNFSAYRGTANINRITRLNADGSLDTGFHTYTGQFPGFLEYDNNCVVLSPDGSGDIYTIGWGKTYNGTRVNSIARINRNGQLD